MNALKEPSDKKLLASMADRLLEAQQEIDEFVVQLALGKAEARDEFEKLKKEFRLKVHDFKLALHDIKDRVMSQDMRQRLDELELQLALGKAETKIAYEDQKKKITKAIQSVEGVVRHWFDALESSPEFSHELEKFKLKLEILRLRFQVKKFEVKDGFRDQMKKARGEIKKLVELTNGNVSTRQNRFDDFTKEISRSYDHLKRAVKKL